MVEENERGTYTPPTEDHLSYGHRRPAPRRDQTPITLIASFIVLVVLLLAVVLFYNSGLNTRKVSDVGDPITAYKDGNIEEAKPLSDEDLLDPSVNQEAHTSGTAPIFANDAEAPQARETASATAPAGSANDNLLPPAQTTPAAPPAVAPAQQPAPAPVVAKPAEAAKAPEVKTDPKPVAAASGGASVQIGAFSSQAIADREFAALASSYGLFVGGTRKVVEKVDRDGSTFYRTSFSGFASKDKAQQFCNALKSAGKTCFVK
ncbi:SPOR domain-containing protein [Asticcacaulis sp. AND118]|uniref:SPOR domain-containing protein n=1 Tax=Asticcacaulis sp. AND118 TaxID=2840468 RepID=UPI001CFFF252|nr:SPOR domain-containing protein [Asticcacaulis sp. AND118]UDF05292.1 SPOR domain-containing protein [Asticcacaulis sp. AND118]